MTDHPMLARNAVEDDAYCDGVFAEMRLDGASGYDRIRALLECRRAALHDPSAAYNLGNMLGSRTDRPARKRTAADLYVHAIGMVRERLEDADATEGWPVRERSLRRVGSMALVNLGNIRQYALGLREEAHEDYLQAARLYDGNEIAHLNIGQMNYGALVAEPDGELAYRHYLRALAAGIRCKSRMPGCECLTVITDALGAVPAGERTAAMPRIREAVTHGDSGIEMPPTDGVPTALAARIEAAVDDAFADLDADSPIERRVTRIASMTATTAAVLDMLSTGAADGASAMAIAETVVDALRSSARPADRLLMPQRTPVESAGPEACQAMYDTAEVGVVYRAISRFMRGMLTLAAGGERAAFTHAIKTVLASASPAWRGGILSTAANGFLNPPISGIVRIAVPGAIGTQSPVEAMKEWARSPSTMR